MSKSDKPLFTHHAHALEKEYQECPQCGSVLSIKHGKSGAFLGCTNYPECQFTRAVVEHERVDDRVLAGSTCPLCSHELAVKQGRYGMFIGCTNYPECHHIEESQSQEIMGVACPSCQNKGLTGQLKEKSNRFGKKFYSCDAYPDCKFVVNHEPVAGECEKCQFPLLLKRTMAAGIKYQCADKKCSFMQKLT